LREQFRRKRRNFGWFANNAVTGGKCGTYLHSQRDYWPVPCDDYADNANRLRHGIGKLTAGIKGAQQFSGQLITPASIIACPSNRRFNTALSDHQRRATIKSSHLSKLGFVSFKEISEPV